MPRFSGRQEHGQCHWDPRVKSLSLKQNKEKAREVSPWRNQHFCCPNDQNNGIFPGSEKSWINEKGESEDRQRRAKSSFSQHRSSCGTARKATGLLTLGKIKRPGWIQSLFHNLPQSLDKHLNISKFNILICKMGILMQYLPCGATIELICIKELLGQLPLLLPTFEPQML